MKVLVACEFSGTVRDAFAKRGHYAVSCDLLGTKANGNHVRWDAVLAAYFEDRWDLMIAHPPCTYLCASGLHWNDRGRGWRETETALQFVRTLLAAPIPMIALENPQGCIGTRIRKADQYIQPYQFGHDASKKTGLWLKNLPPLKPTRHVKGRIVVHNNRLAERWANQTDSGQNKLPPSADRWALRSETYKGIAEAMADQWGQC